MGSGVPTKPLRERTVVLRPQLGHENVHAGASPPLNTQRFAAMDVIVNGGAYAVHIVEALRHDDERCLGGVVCVGGRGDTASIQQVKMTHNVRAKRKLVYRVA
jgi:hypothetical protein